ncbi:MAG: hypothetical protein C5B53_13435 [Candidatus Melainabacteria bacterium]|nr:MAG: hypothetical protein C5B53_13435 [Candidatus Melainabacteria bacterium]
MFGNLLKPQLAFTLRYFATSARQELPEAWQLPLVKRVNPLLRTAKASPTSQPLAGLKPPPAPQSYAAIAYVIEFPGSDLAKAALRLST